MTPRSYRAHSTGLIAKKFLERLEQGVLADRTKQTRRGQSLKLIPVPRALRVRPRPTATDSR